MAIDNVNKRYSMLNFGRQSILPMIKPDNTIDEGDRYHYLSLYFGITLDSLTPSTFQVAWAMNSTLTTGIQGTASA